jgi:hypothetical protein
MQIHGKRMDTYMLWFICVLAAVAGGAIGMFFARIGKDEKGTKRLAGFLGSALIAVAAGSLIGWLNQSLGLPVALALAADLLLYVLAA